MPPTGGTPRAPTSVPASPPVQDVIVDDLMAEEGLDAIVALTNGPAWPTNDDPTEGDLDGRFGEFFVGSSSAAAVSGYADITVPAAYIEGRRSGSRSSAALGRAGADRPRV